jgi:hypothetical protein
LAQELQAREAQQLIPGCFMVENDHTADDGTIRGMFEN